MPEEKSTSVPTYSIDKKYIPFILLSVLLVIIIISSLLLSGIVGSQPQSKSVAITKNVSPTYTSSAIYTSSPEITITLTPSSQTTIQPQPAYVSYENKDLGFKINALNWSIYDNACGKNTTGYFIDSSLRTPAQNPIILYDTDRNEVVLVSSKTLIENDYVGLNPATNDPTYKSCKIVNTTLDLYQEFMKSAKSQTHLGETTISTLVLYDYYKIASSQDPVVFLKSMYEAGTSTVLCHFTLKDKSQNSRVEHFTGGCDNEGGSTSNQFYFDTKNHIILAQPGRQNGPDTQLPTGVLPVEFL